jgi:Rad3-related DNA helicase
MLTDPVLQAKSRQIVAEALAQGIDERTAQSSTFSKLQVPALLTDLRQGAGRLIRSKTDRGVLAILDTRIFNGNGKARPGPEQRTFKGYGALAVESIGFNRHVFDYSAIASVYAYWAANP